MNKNASVTMAAAVAVAGILTLAVLPIATQHQAFAQAYNQGSSYDNNNNQPPCCEKQQPPCDNDHNKCCDKKEIAIGGNGGSGGAGGAGGEGGAGGKNIQYTAYVTSNSNSSSIDQKANGGDAEGGHGGNANGGDASA